MDYLLAMVSLGLALVGFFCAGLPAIALGSVAVMFAFFASRRGERFYQFGMFLGAMLLIFVNLQNMEIIQPAAARQIGRLYRSLRLTIKVHETLKAGDAEQTQRLVVAALAAADRVDVRPISARLPDFAGHFQDEYRGGLKLLSAAGDELGPRLQGALLLDSWGRWSRGQQAAFEAIRKEQTSPAGFFVGLIKY